MNILIRSRSVVLLAGLLTVGSATSLPAAESAADAPQGETVQHSKDVPQGYKLVWHDEFDGATLDTKKWGYRMDGRQRGAGLVSRKSVRLDQQGNLLLETHDRDSQLLTSMISTQGKFEPTFGYFEARIKFNRLQGHHGAFWMQSPIYGKYLGDAARSGAEIDIVEYFGSGRSDRGLGINVYYKGTNGEKTHVSGKYDLQPILGLKTKQTDRQLSDEFHRFAVEWTRNKYEFSIDGHRIFTTDQGISHHNEYIILSLICENWEASRLDHTQLPDAMTVDYVRVYQKRELP